MSDPDPFDPFRQPDRQIVAVAKFALPVLIDRLGGSVTITVAEGLDLEARYGGHAAIAAEISKDKQTWTIKVVPATPRIEKAQA